MGKFLYATPAIGNDNISEKMLEEIDAILHSEYERAVKLLTENRDKLDKLTHAGSHGIDCSIKTVEAIFDIKADYCVKVNFKSVVDIVDALGGITVNSEFKFTSDASLSGKFYDFNVGENFLKGDQALAFARERKSFQKGDIQRGIHQQVIIKAIFNKLISPSILNPAKLNDILSAITSNMKTNISGSDIKALVRMQQNDMASWDIQTTYVEGTGTMRPTYSMGSQELSVKLPNKESIAAAKQAMEAILAE
jgi:LCP family protein required for cell wall assembly